MENNPGCMMPFSSKKNYSTNLSSIDSLKKEIEEEVVQFEKKLEAHPYIKTKEIISLQYPNWQEKVELIDSFLPKEEEEEGDSLLFDAARLVEKYQTVSSSLIQQKFGIMYNRANRIMNELAELEIIDLQNKGVLIQDEYSLEMLLKTLQDKQQSTTVNSILVGTSELEEAVKKGKESLKNAETMGTLRNMDKKIAKIQNKYKGTKYEKWDK